MPCLAPSPPSTMPNLTSGQLAPLPMKYLVGATPSTQAVIHLAFSLPSIGQQEIFFHISISGRRCFNKGEELILDLRDFLSILSACNPFYPSNDLPGLQSTKYRSAGNILPYFSKWEEMF